MNDEGERPKRRRLPEPTPFDRAVRFLAVRDRSEKEVRIKLRQKQVGPEEIDATVEKLRRLGYLDEQRMSRARAESLVARGRLGARGVASKLGAAGVGRELVRQAVDQAMDGKDEAQMALALVKRRYPEALGTTDQRLRARAMRFLMARGFASAVIGRVLRAEVEEMDEGVE